MSAAENLEQLAERSERLINAALVPPALTVARGLFNEVRLPQALDQLEKCRRFVVDAPDLVAAALEARVAAREKVGHAKDELATATAEAEWALSARFVVEGNKTFLVTRYREGDEHPPNAVPVDGEPGVFEARQPMLAADQDRWKRQRASEDPAVKRATAALAQAEHALAVCDVDYERAQDRWQASRVQADLARTAADAAIASLNCLARTLEGAR